MKPTNRFATVATLGLLLALAAPGCMDPEAPGNLVPRTVEEDASLPRIEVNGTVLHAEAYGDPAAPLVVMLHGGPGGDYRELLPYRALADDGFRVVFFDNRGSGLSKRHDASSYSFPQYLEDLRLVIEHYTVASDQPVVLLGQSWGAMYAVWFINEHGDYGGRVAGAILSEPGAFTSHGLEDYIADSFPPWGLTSEALNDVGWSEGFMSPSDHARADYQDAVMIATGFPKQHDDPENPAPFWRPGAVVRAKLTQLGLDDGFDWTTHLGEFPHEVLFLRGELNENMPLAHQQALAANFVSSEIVTVLGAGHEVLWEKQAECLGHVRAYLAGLGLGSTNAKGGAR